MTKNKPNNILKDNTLSKDKEKILLLIMLCPPLGLFLAFKKKYFNKTILIIISLFCLVFLLLVIDTINVPNRLLDKNIEKTFNDLSDYGTFRFGEKKGIYNNTYIIYNVVSSNGVYDLYLDNNKGKTISFIKEISPERKDIKITQEIPSELKNIYSEILTLYINNTQFGDILNVISSNESEQKLKTSKGEFNFLIKYNKVSDVYENKDNILTKVYTEENLIEMPSYLKNKLRKKDNIYKNFQIISYNLTSNSREYIIHTINDYYKIVFFDNKTIYIYTQ